MDISKIRNFFKEKGGLHDSIIVAIDYYEENVDIEIDDIDWNSVGFPEYKGPQAAIIRCICARSPNIKMRELNDSNSGWIVDCKVEEINKNIHIEFLFNNGGYIKLLCNKFCIVDKMGNHIIT